MNEKKYVNRERQIQPQSLTEYDEQAARERRARRIQEMKRQKARRLLIQKCVMIAVPILAIVLVGTVLLTAAGKASAKHDKGTVQGENTEAGGNLGVDTVGNKAENTGAGTAAGGNSAGETSGESAGEGNFQAGNENGNALPQDGMQDPEDTLGADSGNEDEKEKKIYSAQATDDTRWIGDEIISTNAIFIDLETGNILGQKDPYKVLSPASMTKILTLLVAAEQLETAAQLDDTYTIDLSITDYCYVNECSVAGFNRDEAVTVRNLMYGTILPSGAEAALGLANYVAGSHEAFVELMNEKVAELGLSDTAHFTNCVGLYDKRNVCTVYDIAMILRAAMENDLCREVLTTKIYQIPANDEHPDGMTLSNWFLRRIEDYVPDGMRVIGAKTGYVSQAGNCAASIAQTTDGDYYICVTANTTSSKQCIQDHVQLYTTYMGY